MNKLDDFPWIVYLNIEMRPIKFNLRVVNYGNSSIKGYQMESEGWAQEGENQKIAKE